MLICVASLSYTAYLLIKNQKLKTVCYRYKAYVFEAIKELKDSHVTFKNDLNELKAKG